MGSGEARATRDRSPRGQGERLRGELLAAAGRLLEGAPDGAAVSLRAVAREAGIAAPSVYLHFADKGELMMAVLAERFAEFGATLRAAVEAERTPRARLRALCVAYADAAQAAPGRYRIMFGVPPAAGQAPEGTLPGADLIELVARLVAACGDGDGDADGGDGDARSTALLLWAGLHGLVTLRENRPAIGWPDRDQQVDALLAALVPGRR